MRSRHQGTELSRLFESQRAAAIRKRALVEKLRAHPVGADSPAAPLDYPASEAAPALAGQYDLLPNPFFENAALTDNPRPPSREDSSANYLAIEDYVQAADVSVRLWNCIKRDRALATFNVFDAIDNETAFRVVCNRVYQMGSKSIDELISLIRRCPPDVSLIAKEQIIASSAPAPETKAPPAWMQVTIAKALDEFDLSVRLARAEPLGILDELTVNDFVEGSERYKNLFKGQRGFGRKSLKELSILLQEYVDARNSISTIETTDGLGSHPVDQQNGLPQRLSAEEVRTAVHRAIDALEKKQIEVIKKRYGLDGFAKHTLNEIAQQVHVTRERVRQVESKALRQLGAKRHRSLFENLLADNFDNTWTVLSGEHGGISDESLSQGRGRTDPLVLLSIDILHGGIPEWLHSVATRGAQGWIRSARQAKDLAEDTHRLQLALRDMPSPMPVRTVAILSGLTPERVCAALSTSRSPRVFDGYVVEGHLGARAKRTIVAHKVAQEKYSSAFDLIGLVLACKDRADADDGGSRNIRIVVDEAPHLFGSLFENLYFALGSRPIERLQALPYELEEVDDVFEERSIGAWLKQYLHDHGPTRLQDLRRAAVAQFGGGISETSIGAILSSNPCFRRIAPGVFDICRSSSGRLRDEATLSILLDERQCRLYCYARFSGAPINFFPAWGDWYEMHLVKWASTAVNTDLFRSLMSVAKPRLWPTSGVETASWIDLKSQQARWCLAGPRRYALGRRIPSPEQFFSALAYLVIFGSIGCQPFC